MSQGTISVLLGCHSPIHSILVILAWKKMHMRWPRPWETACIFLHDIGHWGKQYLDDYEQKKEHWRLGANIAFKLFGEKGYMLVAGHCNSSGSPKSDLYKPDKYSWYIAPTLWLYSNTIFEPPLRGHVISFQKQVKSSVESGLFESSHGMYLRRKAEQEEAK